MSRLHEHIYIYTIHIASSSIKNYFLNQYFIFRPDVKISEDASSDKSGTDPEDSSDNFSQADITDYQNYEQVQLEVRTIFIF